LDQLLLQTPLHSITNSYLCMFYRTNVLEKYDNRDIILTLPDGKKINEIQWIAVFDLSRLVDLSMNSSVLTRVHMS